MRVPAKSIPPTALSSEKRPASVPPDLGPHPPALRLNIKCIAIGGTAYQHSRMKAFLALALVALASSFTATAQIPTGAAADLVLGQPDFETNGTAPVSDTSLNRPRGIAIDPTTGKLFIADTNNNRVLRYPSISSLTDGTAADIVLGQTNFTDVDPNRGLAAPTASTLDDPKGLAVDAAGRLWVVDENNNRVLMFENASALTSGAPASKVLGQSDFISFNNGSSASGMQLPNSLHVDPAGNLWVCSGSGAARVVRFADAANKMNGADADQVIGQVAFGAVGSGLAADKFDNPQGVFVDAVGTLWVADHANHRVVGFSNAASLGNGPDADRVFGQPDFVSNAQNTTADGMDSPVSVSVDPFGALWVIERLNNRMVRFDEISTKANGANADGVIGQVDFVSSTSGLSATKLSSQFTSSLTFDGFGNLWTTDNSNNRALRFTRPPTPAAPPDTTRPAIRLRGRKSIETLRKRVVVRGTATDAGGISEIDVKTRRGAELKKLRGTIRWKAVFRVTKDRGRVVVKFRAVDAAGNRSKVSRFRILRR